MIKSCIVENTCKINSPLVDDQQVIDVQLYSEQQANNKQTVRDNRRRRRFQSEGVEDELLDIIGQSFAFPENVQGTVQENMAHPSMVGNTEGKVLPVHGFKIAEDAIDDPQVDSRSESPS